jgi:hypothetical protein
MLFAIKRQAFEICDMAIKPPAAARPAFIQAPGGKQHGQRRLACVEIRTGTF